MKNIKILFIGCVESSYILLSKLIESGKNVVGVITKEKSDFNADFSDLSPLCQQHNIPFLHVKNANEPEAIAFAKNLSPDICYCFGWSQLLKEELLSIFPIGTVGFHPAALPNNRGRHPIIWALALGLKETASSFFMITLGTDDGPIISQKIIAIDYEDDAKTLYDKILKTAVEQEIEFTNNFENEAVHFVSQDPSTGNSWRKREKKDGQIDWRMSSYTIYNLVRSLTKPYPGAHFVFKNEEYKVWKVQELRADGLENIEPGKVLDITDEGYMDIRVSDGIIRLLQYDKPILQKGDYLL